MPYEAIRPNGGGITTIVICSIIIPFTVLFVGLRILARLMLRKKLELNDYSIVVGATFAVANAALTIATVIYGGIGHEPSEVNRATPTLMKFTTALSLICNLAHTIIKFSIVHLYLDIFSGSKHMACASYAVIFIILGYSIANVVVELLTCKATGMDWHKHVDEKACARQKVQHLSGAIFNMVTDIAIVTLPLTQIWGLKMDRSKKRGLVVIFGLGFIICIISALRVDAIMRVSYDNLAYSLVSLSIYSVVEPCLAAINACLPLLQPLRNKFAKWRVSKAPRSDGESESTGVEQYSPEFAGPTAPKASRARALFHNFDNDLSVDIEALGHSTVLTTISGPGR